MSDEVNQSPALSTNLISRQYTGPISSVLWSKVSTLESSYQDSFDWGVYDRLFYKHEGTAPKAGVLFKTNLKLVNYHSTCSKCHYSVVIDTYGRGCSHNCAYCYAKEMLAKYGSWNSPHPFPMDLSELRKTFFTVFETDKPSKWRSILESRVPLRIGSMSDSFMPMERKFGISKELLRILRHYRYPYIIFTRGILIAEDDYLDAIDPTLAAVQFSMCGPNEEITRKLEPGAPSVSARLSALAKLGQRGIRTAVRIHPLFPTFPDGYFTDRQALISRFPSGTPIPEFNLCDIRTCGEFFARIRAAGVPTLLVGFGYFTDSAIKQTKLATGFDLRQFLLPEIASKRGAKTYSENEITFYYKKMQAEAARADLRFTTCFVGHGAQAYYRHQELWSNKADCCDVRGNLPAFKNSSQQIPWNERLRHAPCKTEATEAQFAEQEAESKYAHQGNPQSNIHSPLLPEQRFEDRL